MAWLLKPDLRRCCAADAGQRERERIGWREDGKGRKCLSHNIPSFPVEWKLISPDLIPFVFFPPSLDLQGNAIHLIYHHT